MRVGDEQANHDRGSQMATIAGRMRERNMGMPSTRGHRT
jgi:hypothetical protein